MNFLDSASPACHWTMFDLDEVAYAHAVTNDYVRPIDIE